MNLDTMTRLHGQPTHKIVINPDGNATTYEYDGNTYFVLAHITSDYLDPQDVADEVQADMETEGTEFAEELDVTEGENTVRYLWDSETVVCEQCEEEVEATIDTEQGNICPECDNANRQ